MRLAHCRSCGAPIIWTVTTNGKTMPVDADPVIAKAGFGIDDADPDRLVAVFTAAPGAGEKVHLSHFATCPDAATHRRPA